MSGTSFRSVYMVASCAAAALGCYLISLRVASERAALEEVETQIVLAERDIRLLQTEIGTRGRLAQLERWNVRVLALSAPSADQFLGGSFELARLIAPERKIDLEAPVVLATAPADAPKPQVERVAGEAAESDEPPASGKELLHSASIRRDGGIDEKPASTKPTTAAKAAAVVETKEKKSVDKPVVTTAKSVTKQRKLAKADPPAPLPASKSTKPAKDSSRKP